MRGDGRRRAGDGPDHAARRRCIRWHPPEQCEPRAPSAIDGASVEPRENRHRRRGYHLGSIAVLVLVLTGLLWSLEALAQNLPAKEKLAKERASVSVRARGKPAKEDDGAGPSLRNDEISIRIQTPDVITYLLENRGKISLLSGLHGKVQLELGLFGYIGLKYQF